MWHMTTDCTNCITYSRGTSIVSRTFSLPDYGYEWEGDARPSNPLIAEERAYDQASLAREADRQVQNLSPSQKAAYDRIMDALEADSQSAFFFLNGPGGTGKTYLYNTLCNRLRGEGKIVLFVASTGIAWTLLPGGRTVHKRFEVPIAVSENSGCNISRQSQLTELIRRADVLIWDEPPHVARPRPECPRPFSPRYQRWASHYLWGVISNKRSLSSRSVPAKTLSMRPCTTRPSGSMYKCHHSRKTCASATAFLTIEVRRMAWPALNRSLLPSFRETP